MWDIFIHFNLKLFHFVLSLIDWYFSCFYFLLFSFISFYFILFSFILFDIIINFIFNFIINFTINFIISILCLWLLRVVGYLLEGVLRAAMQPILTSDCVTESAGGDVSRVFRTLKRIR